MWSRLTVPTTSGVTTSLFRPRFRSNCNSIRGNSNIASHVCSPQQSLSRWSTSSSCVLLSVVSHVHHHHHHHHHFSSLLDRALIAAVNDLRHHHNHHHHHQRPIDRASTSDISSSSCGSSRVSSAPSAARERRDFGAKNFALNIRRTNYFSCVAVKQSSVPPFAAPTSNNNRPQLSVVRQHWTWTHNHWGLHNNQLNSVTPLRLHLSSSTSTTTTTRMDRIHTSSTANLNQNKRGSLFDSSESDEGSDSIEDSLPVLNESGHHHYGQPLTSPRTTNKFLKTCPPERKVYRIVVEGNIGSGKTTFLKIFSKNCSTLSNKPLIVPEPIDLWRNVGGVNIFQLLGDDPKRWSFAFQSYVQLTMVKIHEMQPDEGNFKVMERSLFSARYCFVENLFRKGLLEPCEYFILDQWFQASLPSAAVDLIIYLKSDPDVVYDRIKKRARPEESGLTLEYLRTLHQLHEDWLVHRKFSLPCEVLTIDANTPLDQILAVYEEKTDDILREHLLVQA